MFAGVPCVTLVAAQKPAIVELLQTAKIIGSETFRYNEPITLVGLILLALSLVSAAFIRRVERWSYRWR